MSAQRLICNKRTEDVLTRTLWEGLLTATRLFVSPPCHFLINPARLPTYRSTGELQAEDRIPDIQIYQMAASGSCQMSHP